jgi:ubiquinone/menaquinone biosynthesis C-methylase UbiE
MEGVRKPLQGVTNIIRFNWHFYLLSVCLLVAIVLLNVFFNSPYLIYSKVLFALLAAAILVSTLTSYYVYDLSGLYKLQWLEKVAIKTNARMVNIHSGFDETSVLLAEKYPDAKLTVFDFYDPLKHTEVSIKRARKAYPPYKGTMHVNTDNLTLDNNSVDNVFTILAAHEIRNEDERKVFFEEIKRILKPGGNIIVVEHLRDLPNFLAYNFGFFHFLPKSSWKKVFRHADLNIFAQFTITPFITVFVLEKYGA